MYASNFLPTTEAAEDIVQELFTTMWEKKITFLSFASFRTYLFNSIRNASLNYLKHQNVESLYLEKLKETYQDVHEDDATEEEVYHLLFSTIDRLPERCREIFLMHMDGKKNEEIALALNISIETVKTQKKRAIRFIKEQLGTVFYILLIYDLLPKSEYFP